MNLSSVVQLPGAAFGATLKNEDQQSNKPRGLLIHGFPAEWTDTSIRDGLVRDYKKYYRGRGLTVIVEGQGDARYAVVSFKRHEYAARALEDSKGERFCGAKVTVTTHQGFEIENSENRLCEADYNEFSEKATRTLFLGDLDKTTTEDMLRGLFSKYGFIINIDIKKPRRALSYAFIQFDNIRSVVQALNYMDDNVGTRKFKFAFGKGIPSNCVWVDGVSDTVSEEYLTNQFLEFGVVMNTRIDRRTGRALIFFETSDHASAAVSEMRGKCIQEKKIQVDFASPECQNLFLDNLEMTGQLRPGDQLNMETTDDADRGGCTPPCGPQEFISRSSSPSRERLDDPFTFRYGDAKNKDSEPSNPGESGKDRSGGGATQHEYLAGYSLANSNSSQISKGRTMKWDSGSTSPVSAKERFEKEQSMSLANKDYLWNSISTDKAVYGKPPHAGSSYKKLRLSRCDDDSDVTSDRDRSLHSLDQPLLQPKRIIDEPGARRRSVELPSDLERQRKFELEIARNLGGYPPSSGSARGEFGAEFGATGSVVKHQLSPKYDERASGDFSMMDFSLVRWFSNSVAVAQLSGGSTTPGSKTPVNNSNQDSLGGRNFHGSDDVQTREKQKQLLLNLLKQMETTSDSDVELLEDEARKELMVVDDDSDLELGNDSESLLRKEYILKADDWKNHVAGIHDTDLGKKDGGVKSKDLVKLKSINTSQSFCKPMEAQQGDLGSRSSSASPVQSVQPDRLAQMSCRDPLDVVDP